MGNRIEAVNAALATFTGRPGYSQPVRIGKEKTGHIRVEWGPPDRRRSRRWITMRGNSHYPVWHRRAPWGGTQSTAISFLVRWVQNKPVYGLESWTYWASDSIKLCTAETVEVLRQAGYPERAKCVLCGAEGCGDWWDLDGVTGPCCTWRSGCKQEGANSLERAEAAKEPTE